VNVFDVNKSSIGPITPGIQSPHVLAQQTLLAGLFIQTTNTSDITSGYLMDGIWKCERSLFEQIHGNILLSVCTLVFRGDSPDWESQVLRISDI
jgi:hypothetical protein